MSGTNWGNYIGSFSLPACSPNLDPPGKAVNPSPGNGGTNVAIDADLSWTAGSGATGHIVTFDGTGYPERGGTTFDPGPLAYSTTYNWQVDEVNEYGTTSGDPWSFTTRAVPVPPGPATNPSPADGAFAVSVTTNLNWTADSGADSHDVYFGTNPSPGSGEFQGNQTATGFNPSSLADSTTYYWRIDEVNSDGTTAGPVWSFTTEDIPVQAFHVKSIVVDSEFQNGQRYRGVATILVHDEGGGPVPGVEISGTFSGDWAGIRGGTTDSSGLLIVETPPVKNGSSWDYCVNTASKAGWNHDAGTSAPWLCGAPQPSGSIAGFVKDAVTTLAISGASVSADSGEITSTAADGSYTLSNVPTGSHTVTISASGYVTAVDSTTVTDGGTSTLDFALTPSSGGSIAVRSITVSTVNQGKGNKSGRAVVVVEDDQGSVVPGAAVSGNFSGTFNEASGPSDTNASGSVTFDTSGMAKGGVSVTFCVTGISHPALDDFTGEVCSSL